MEFSAMSSVFGLFSALDSISRLTRFATCSLRLQDPGMSRRLWSLAALFVRRDFLGVSWPEVTAAVSW